MGVYAGTAHVGAATRHPLPPRAPVPVAHRLRTPNGGPGQFAEVLRQAQSRRAAGPVAQPPPAEEPTLVGDVDPAALPEGRAAVLWAARELESELWMWVLQDALSASPGAGLFGGGFAGSVYQDWMARALAEEMARSGAGTLAQALAEQLVPGSGTISGKPR